MLLEGGPIKWMPCKLCDCAHAHFKCHASMFHGKVYIMCPKNHVMKSFDAPDTAIPDCVITSEIFLL